MHRLLGDAVDVGRELLATAAERDEEIAALLVEDLRQLQGALVDAGVELLGLGRHAADHFGAHPQQRALDLAGVLLEHVAGAGGDRAEPALDLVGLLLERGGRGREHALGLLRARAHGLDRRGRQLGQRLFGFSGVGLDGVAELLEPRRHGGGDGLAAYFDLARHGLDAADQQLLEAGDAGIEIAGDLHGAHAERLVDLVGLCGERVGDLAAAGIDGGRDVADALLQRADDLLAALRQGLGNVQHAIAERLVERLRAGVERLLDARDALIEPGGELGRPGGDAVIEILDVGVHPLGQLGRMLAEALHQLAAAIAETLDVGAHLLGQLGGIVAEPFHQLAAVDLHRAIELGEMPGDQLAQRAAVL